MPCSIRAARFQPFRDLDLQADQQQANPNESRIQEIEIDKMNGKVLVIGIGLFFILFFVIESWLMRGLAHEPIRNIAQTSHRSAIH